MTHTCYIHRKGLEKRYISPSLMSYLIDLESDIFHHTDWPVLYSFISILPKIMMNGLSSIQLLEMCKETETMKLAKYSAFLGTI